MPLEIIRNDITRMHVDAIVNAANSSLLGGGGVDGAIHRAAGPELLEACRGLNGCWTGDAKITKGYRLPCRYVIHTVGPVWQGGQRGEEELLASCYWRSLLLARKHGCRSVAFPLISAGAYRYPREQALRVAVETVRDFLMEEDDGELLVYIVVFDRDSFQIGEQLYAGIASYIDDRYADEHLLRRMKWRFGASSRREGRSQPVEGMPEPDWSKAYSDNFGAADFGEAQSSDGDASGFFDAMPCAPTAPAMSLEDALACIDESFSAMVLRKIDEKGMTDPECYKRANLDRKLFSKLRKDAHYRPKKQTALALAMALELSLEETRELLMKAGFALSHSDKADIIVEYFIEQGNYNVFEINMALFRFDQVPLGGRLA